MTMLDGRVTATKIAAVIRCSMRMVHFHCRAGLLARYARKTHGVWLIDAAALQDPRVWEALTGTADRRRWPEGWTGSRLGKKKRLKLGLP